MRIRERECIPDIDLPRRQTQVLCDAILGVAVGLRAALEEVFKECSLFRRRPLPLSLFIALGTWLLQLLPVTQLLLIFIRVANARLFVGLLRWREVGLVFVGEVLGMLLR